LEMALPLLTLDFSGAAVKAEALATRVAITASFIFAILVLKSEKEREACETRNDDKNTTELPAEHRR
jgi:hypothetical protein